MADNISVGGITYATHDRGSGVQAQKVEVTGEQPAATAGTITTATSTVSVSVSNYGQASIVIAGTYAGVAIVFEASVNAGTTWFGLQVAREADGAALLADTLASNATVAYLLDLPGGVTDVRVRATAWTSGTANVVLAPSGQVAMPVVSIGNFTSGTGGTTSVTGTATANTTLLAANNARVGATIYNDSTATLTVLLGAGTQSATVFTTKVPAGGYYEVPFRFTGRIAGQWATATGAARVTEFTA